MQQPNDKNMYIHEKIAMRIPSDGSSARLLESHMPITLRPFQVRIWSPRGPIHMKSSRTHTIGDWNRFPLAPPDMKLVMIDSPRTRGSWEPRGIDEWYLGPAKNHYRYWMFYVPEMRAYQNSGFAESFPHHCQTPSFKPGEHLQENSTMS